MVKGKSLKLTTVALMIFTVLAFAAWAVFFVIFAIKEGILPGHLAQMGLLLLPPYAVAAGVNVIYSISSLALLALTIIFFLLMLIFSIFKRRGLMILPYFLICFATFALVEFINNMPATNIIDGSTTGYLSYLAISDAAFISQKIMAIGTMVCAILTYALAFLTYLLAMIHTCKYPKRKHPEVDEKLDETRVIPEGAPADINGFLPEPEPERASMSDREELLLMIREVIHAELNNQPAPTNNTNNVTGANFSAPLVVQYFNGNGQQTGNQGEEKKVEKEEQAVPVVKAEPVVEEVVEPELIEDEPEEKPAPVQEPVKEPEPVKEEPKPEPEPQPEPEPEPVVEEPAPEPVPEPVVEEPVVEEKPKIIRIPFEERITTAEKEMKDNYNELKNDIMAYGVKSRVSNSGDTFRLHRKTYVKLTIAGKSLKLYFALNPDDYKDSTLPIQDASEKNIYAEIPLVFKVKSGLSMRRAKQLVADVMAQDGLVQGEVGKVNWVKEIAIAMKEGRKASSKDDD